MRDQIRTSLINHLGRQPDTPQEVNSNISNISPHTGDGNTSCASTVNSTNTTNKILKTKDFALQLADSRAKQAQQEDLITQLQQQMKALKQLNNTAESGTQQGAPHLSGSGASPP
jgi:ribosomal protein S24E